MKSYPTMGILPIILDRRPAPLSPARNDFPGMKSTNRAPREEILHRAYALWEREGRPVNRKLAHWLEAEAEVMGRVGGR
jgi:hypothetical protein